MALYDNKYWLLSHIRNSFISTDDTGMCELVMVGEDLPKQLVETLDTYPDTDESQEEDEIEHESYDIQFDTDFSVRHRSNTAARLEKMDLARKRASKIKNIKWQSHPDPMSKEEMDELFVKRDLSVDKPPVATKSLFTETMAASSHIPKNPFMYYAKFDGSAQVGVAVKKYKIFLTMLPEAQRNYPVTIVCVATAKIYDLIGLICLKCSSCPLSNLLGDLQMQPVSNYGLYITEEDGEVDRDFPCLEPKECVSKFGFTCLGLVEHKHMKNVNFETVESINFDSIHEEEESTESALEESKRIKEHMEALKAHKTALEAPLYKPYNVSIINKMRGKVEIHLGISGEKIEIDPVQQTYKFNIVKQKAVSHHMDTVAFCEILDTKGNKSNFRLTYSQAFGNNFDFEGSSMHSSATFKHYDFEADSGVADEIVAKINHILDVRSSMSRKEYLASRERKQMRRRSFHMSK